MQMRSTPKIAAVMLMAWCSLTSCSTGNHEEAPAELGNEKTPAINIHDTAAPAAPDVMKQFSYPKLGFQIKFPTRWTVRDKSGDLGDYTVEGRSSADTPSGLDDSKPSVSKSQQQLADIAFLKGVRVTILIRDIQLERVSLLQGVSNRIQGMTLMRGNDVDVKPLAQVQLATVPAFVTRYTERNDEGQAGKISTTTTDYDLDHGTHRYVISLEAPSDEFNKHADEFASIVRSFTFIEAPSPSVALNISGLWTGASAGPCPDNPTVICDDGYLRTYSFRQNGEELTGTFAGVSRYLAERNQRPTTVQLEDGKVQEHKISFAWHTKSIGVKWTSEGTIEGDEIILTDKSEGGTPEAMTHSYTLKKQ